MDMSYVLSRKELNNLGIISPSRNRTGSNITLVLVLKVGTSRGLFCPDWQL